MRSGARITLPSGSRHLISKDLFMWGYVKVPRVDVLNKWSDTKAEYTRSQDRRESTNLLTEKFWISLNVSVFLWYEWEVELNNLLCPGTALQTFCTYHWLSLGVTFHTVCNIAKFHASPNIESRTTESLYLGTSAIYTNIGWKCII
jgi:hypothetical protein